MKRIALLLCVILLHGKMIAGDSSESHSKYLSFSASYLELKDEINHGFVFRGPDVVAEFGIQNQSKESLFEYSCSIGGGGKTAVDSWGFRWEVTPVDIKYAFNMYESEYFALYGGPNFVINYNIQNYPDMHSGHLNWMTNYSLGFSFTGLINIKSELIKLQLNNSVLSVCSRPELERDQHYFSLNAGDIFSNANSNMSYCASNRFNQTELSVEWLFDGNESSSSLSYVFQYLDYFLSPEYKQLSHSLKYTWYFNHKGNQNEKN